MQRNEADKRRFDGWTRTAAVAVAMLFATLVHAPPGMVDDAEATGSCTDHPPIRIRGDAGHDGLVLVSGTPTYRPGSGVLDGSGTEDDPYLITGWCFGSPFSLLDAEVALEIRETTAHVVIRGNTFEEHARAIRVWGAENVVVEENEISDGGIEVGYSTGGRIAQNVITDAPAAAILLEETSHHVIEENTIYAAGGEGIRLDVTQAVAVRMNNIAWSLTGGIVVGGSGNLIEANVLRSNIVAGIMVTGTGNIITGNGITSGHGDGIAIVGGDANDIRLNDIRVIDHTAIRVLDAADTLIDENAIVGGDLGIHIDQGPGTMVTDNVVQAIKIYSVHLLSSPDAAIEGNTITDSGDDGVLVQNSLRPDIRANSITGGWGDGLRLRDGSHGALITQNTVKGNIDEGIFVWSSERATIEHNELDGNEGYGMKFYSTTLGSVFQNNNVVNNRAGGLYSLQAFDTLDSRHNWWGDASGPLTHEEDGCGGDGTTTGTGQSVYSHPDPICYDPWLSAPDPDAGAP